MVFLMLIMIYNLAWNVGWRDFVEMMDLMWKTIIETSEIFEHKYCVLCGFKIRDINPYVYINLPSRFCSLCSEDIDLDDIHLKYSFCHGCGIRCGDLMYCKDCETKIEKAKKQ